MNSDRFTFLSGDEASDITGGGYRCWLAGGAIVLSIISLHPLAIVAAVVAADQSC
jgi:hypothetical protein